MGVRPRASVAAIQATKWGLNEKKSRRKVKC